MFSDINEMLKLCLHVMLALNIVTKHQELILNKIAELKCMQENESSTLVSFV